MKLDNHNFLVVKKDLYNNIVTEQNPEDADEQSPEELATRKVSFLKIVATAAQRVESDDSIFWEIFNIDDTEFASLCEYCEQASNDEGDNTDWRLMQVDSACTEGDGGDDVMLPTVSGRGMFHGNPFETSASVTLQRGKAVAAAPLKAVFAEISPVQGRVNDALAFSKSLLQRFGEGDWFYITAFVFEAILSGSGIELDPTNNSVDRTVQEKLTAACSKEHPIWKYVKIASSPA